MGSSQSAVETNSVEDWHKYNISRLVNYRYADRIEFNRGSYSHWALYVNNGQVIHLNPANCSEKVEPLSMNKWFDGALTVDKLERVAGNDNIRAVRDNVDNSRPQGDIEMLVDITSSQSIFKYCLKRFNCEHFVNFVKFAKPVSNQILLMEVPTFFTQPSMFGPKFNLVGTTSKLMEMSQRSKIKTRPESTDNVQRKQELVDICIQIAKEVQERPREEIETLLFG